MTADSASSVDLAPSQTSAASCDLAECEAEAGGRRSDDRQHRSTSDFLHFGKLVSRMKCDGKVYMNYRALKQTAADPATFAERFRRELRYVSGFYGQEIAELQSAMEQLDEEKLQRLASLRRLIALNTQAALRVIRKVKALGGSGATAVADAAAVALRGSDWRNALRSEPLFTSLEAAAAQRTQPVLACTMCAGAAVDPFPMPCEHGVACWACAAESESRSPSSCAVCKAPVSLDITQAVLKYAPPERQAAERPRAGAAAAAAEGAAGSGQYFCRDCSMVLNSFRQAQIHVEGIRHKGQMAKMRAKCAREGVPYEPCIPEPKQEQVVTGSRPRRNRGGKRAGAARHNSNILNAPILDPPGDDPFDQAKSVGREGCSPVALAEAAACAEKALQGCDGSLRTLRKLVSSDPKAVVHAMYDLARGRDAMQDCASLCERMLASSEAVTHETELAIMSFKHCLLLYSRTLVENKADLSPSEDASLEEIDATDEYNMRCRIDRVRRLTFAAELYLVGFLPDAFIHCVLQSLIAGASDAAASSSLCLLHLACMILRKTSAKLKLTDPLKVDAVCESLQRAARGCPAGGARLDRLLQAVSTSMAD
eukprot:TRINITY_DN3765_c1_g2_i4.p1 TRINITY_DN3765_c1_g2~~TRINITY_DN3765_c1_g2_i4.p1  ORF type:complete len:597 (+),score=72.57 TRINITY_DN3765_c1_g2_i4:295-2085(+)